MVDESKDKIFSLRKLTIGRGISKEINGEWQRNYCEIQVELYDEDAIDTVEEYVSSIVDGYLHGTTLPATGH